MNLKNDTLALSTPKSSIAWLDVTGIVASWLCAVHCVALPFAVSILPLIGLSFLLSETTERAFIALSIVIAGLSLLPAYIRRHRQLKAIFLFIGGMGLILTSHLLFEESLLPKVVFLLFGGSLITTAHIVNKRLCKACSSCRADQKSQSQ